MGGDDDQDLNSNIHFNESIGSALTQALSLLELAQ
jgi:hypothetical protein